MSGTTVTFAFAAWGLLGVLAGCNINGRNGEVSAPAGIFAVVNGLAFLFCLIILVCRGAGVIP